MSRLQRRQCCGTVMAMQPSLFPQPAKQADTCDRTGQIDSRGRLDLHGQLNKAQYEAATTISGPLLVVAGAGSGKTRTLVYRVVHLINQGIAPEKILLLTFTRKAAQEMLARAGLLLDDCCQDVTGGTFHGIANLLLRRFGHHLGYPANFTILDRADAEGITNILKSSLSLGGAGKRFPSKHVIVNIISKAVNKGVDIEDLLADEYGHLYEFLDDIYLLKKHYDQFKFEHALMDYDDLLINWQRLLSEDADVQREIAGRFSHIMVDEYQDTNPIQASIVRHLAHGHDNVMAVGDDSQSIYSFRGADFRNIMNFPRLFTDTRIIKLEENYRSSQPILTLANTIIDQATEKYTKILFSRIKGDEKPQLYVAKDETAEAAFVVSRIVHLQSTGVALRDMAVLFRSGFHSFKLEIELGSHHIPYEKRGGLKLTEAAHVKDLISYIRTLVNPYDHLSWNRALLMLDKVGPKTAQKILAAIKQADDPLSALDAYPADRKWQAGLRELYELLNSLREPGLAPVDQFDRLYTYYQPIFERLYYDDYPKRSKDIEQLRSIIAGYDSLVAFVADTALDPPEVGEQNDTGDKLVLSTIHSAKGLEWDTVFIINLAEGKFPHAYSLPGEQQEEERRLLYVAATRAKKNLYLTYPCEVISADRKRTRVAMSPFLTGLPPGSYVTIAQEKTGYAAVPYPAGGKRETARGAPVRRSRKGLRPEQLSVGMMVKHPFFGLGRIEMMTGPKSVEVLFDKHGKKNLHLDYAKLEIA
jgi:DNA helicase-2/ATP-dependent DNA helicase PcrA